MWPRQMLTRSNWKSWRSSDNDDGGGEKEAKLSREETPSVFQVWQSHRFISLAAAKGCPVWGDSSSGCSSFAMDPTCRERFPEELLAPASGRILGRLCIAPSFPPLSLLLSYFPGVLAKDAGWKFSRSCIHPNTQCSVHATLRERSEVIQGQNRRVMSPPCAAVPNFLQLTFKLTSWPSTPAGVLSLQVFLSHLICLLCIRLPPPHSASSTSIHLSVPSCRGALSANSLSFLSTLRCLRLD